MIARRLFMYLLPHRKRLAFALAVLILATTADVAGPMLVKIFIDEHLTPRQFDRPSLILLGGGFLALTTSAALLHYVQLLHFQKMALRVIQQLRIDVFGKVQHLGLTFFDKTPAGSLVSRITNDTEAIKDLFVSVLSTFLQNIIFLIGIIIAMFILNVKLALFTLAFVPVLLWLMGLYRKYSSQVYHRSRKKLSQLNARLNESIQGMYMIQAMRQEKRMRQEFAVINQGYFQEGLKNIRLHGLLLRPAVDLVYMFALMVVLGFFGWQKTVGNVVEIGVLYAFINYLDRFFEPVNQMMMRLSQMQMALVSAERVFELLDDPRIAPSGTKTATAPTIIEGHIEFDGVHFSYDGQTDVLRNISFVAEKGQTVALVGHTGSGKSSIINLLMRFYPVEKGEIRIDGIPLRDYSDQELRSNMGLVLQDPFLFVGDVKQNIRLHNEYITDEQLTEAAQFVQADAFIRQLPHGYEEPVGERGATFSSGQRQLLSFARTMAMNPRILVLDEATASVDTETEEAIQEALAKMRQGRTTIAIAHRLSTIQDADLILVLHQGAIVERGNHQELLAAKGLYYKMYLLQQGAMVAN